MSPDCKLRLERNQIAHWASRYLDDLKRSDKELEERIEGSIGPTAKAEGHLTRDGFLTVCRWKSSRPQKHSAANVEEFIHAVTSTALSTPSEQLRIEVLTLLCGVEWPTASAILHFCSNERYPILDVRALWSLSVEEPKAYDFDFWWTYTQFCRRLADEAGVTMRTLDRALWQFSKENQPPTPEKAQSPRPRRSRGVQA